ncbi:hypothetical protein JH852_000586 [Acinetobacter baumannii]
MTAWQRLGIEPTDNQREIKKAYAKQLKLIDQDTQPEEFILLREALETAQFEAEYLIYENEDWITHPLYLKKIILLMTEI